MCPNTEGHDSQFRIDLLAYGPVHQHPTLWQPGQKVNYLTQAYPPRVRRERVHSKTVPENTTNSCCQTKWEILTISSASSRPDCRPLREVKNKTKKKNRTLLFFIFFNTSRKHFCSLHHYRTLFVTSMSFPHGFSFTADTRRRGEKAAKRLLCHLINKWDILMVRVMADGYRGRSVRYLRTILSHGRLTRCESFRVRAATELKDGHEPGTSRPFSGLLKLFLRFHRAWIRSSVKFTTFEKRTWNFIRNLKFSGKLPVYLNSFTSSEISTRGQ